MGEDVTEYMLMSCDECPKLFKSIYGKNDHTNRVHKGILYRCEKCDYKNGNKRALSSIF